MDPGRCTDTQFFVDPQIYHQEILLLCLHVMKGGLKKNICNLNDNTPLNKVEDLPACRVTYITNALEYACSFWTTHLERTTGSSLSVREVRKEIDGFFTTCFLSWVEVLSLLGKLDIGVYSLNDIEQWYTLVSCCGGYIQETCAHAHLGRNFLQVDK